MRSNPSLLSLLAPGLLLAATGVGAGDLATGAFAGAHLGLAVLWAVWVGALLKFVLNEQLARHQLVSGQGVLAAVREGIGPWVLWLFLPYLLLWSLFVSAALISACGLAGHALLPLGQADSGRQWMGVVHALLAAVLVQWGGFALFARLMQLCVLLMFGVVVLTAVQLWPGTGELLSGFVWPRVLPHPQATAWTLALLGGVGGTVTILCYGYWMREVGRDKAEDLRSCRIDLAAAYAVTAIFGLAMVVIGSRLQLDGRGAGLLLEIGQQLEQELGAGSRQLFLIGAWGAMFSSLLGVLQVVPHLIRDLFSQLRRGQSTPAGDGHTAGRSTYLWALWLMAVLPLLGLNQAFVSIQKLYAVAGALFMPALALVLLYLGNRLPAPHRNGWLANFGLIATLLVFAWIAVSA